MGGRGGARALLDVLLDALGLLLCALLLTSCAESTAPDGPRSVLTPAQRAGLEQSNSTATVAVIDGVVDRTHPALRDVVTASWRAPGLAATPNPHAAQMVGIVAGRATGEYGGGVASGARVVVAEVLAADGSGDPADLAAAIDWVRGQRTDVVLMSLALADDPAVADAVADLVAAGVVVIGAAGNGFGDDDPTFPADYPGVLSVTAYDRTGNRLALANWSRADAVVAGGDVSAPAPAGAVAPVSGTSVAAAVAAGLVAACGDHRPLVAASGSLLPAWREGAIEVDGRAVPRLACP